MLQLKDLRMGQWEEPYIGLTQENSIGNSVQDSLPYIPWTHGLCYDSRLKGLSQETTLVLE